MSDRPNGALEEELMSDANRETVAKARKPRFGREFSSVQDSASDGRARSESEHVDGLVGSGTWQTSAAQGEPQPFVDESRHAFVLERDE